MTCSSAPLTIASVGEHALIERIRRRAGKPPDWVTCGIGDDAAILEPARGQFDVVTTDGLVEGVHFRREWTAPAAIGHKALAVSLSDLAAMGATPRAVLLDLALPAALPQDDFDALVEGFMALADRVGMPLVGGNLTRSPGPLMIDVTAIGTAHPRRVLLRRGGRPGDELYLTGSVGAASAGLTLLTSVGDHPIDVSTLEADAAQCLARYERPEPRLTCGIQAGRSRAAAACVDLSDGLADAVRQLAGASGTGAVLDAARIPVHPGARAAAQRLGADPVSFSLAGGEDYELLFAVRPKQRAAFRAVAARCRDVGMTTIGRLTADPGFWLDRGGRLEPLPAGFTHF